MSESKQQQKQQGNAKGQADKSNDRKQVYADVGDDSWKFYALVGVILLVFGGTLLGYFNTYHLPQLIRLAFGITIALGLTSIGVFFIIPIPIALNLSSALKRGVLTWESLAGFTLLTMICYYSAGGVLSTMQDVSKTNLFSNFSVTSQKAVLGTGAMYSKPTDETLATVNRIHVVKKGDSLSELAKHYNVELSELKALNGNKNTIQIGKVIKIP